MKQHVIRLIISELKNKQTTFKFEDEEDRSKYSFNDVVHWLKKKKTLPSVSCYFSFWLWDR
jgi:hypothetical protein